MSNERSNTRFEVPSSHQRHYGSNSGANSIVQGNYSGNFGNNNIYGSGNTIYYHQVQDLLPTDDEVLRCLYRCAYQEQRKRVREPATGTCTWVTEHPNYKNWLEKQTSDLLWLSADPGCGKSVIASFLVTHLETNTNATICYFFFKDDSEDQMSATFALCAILHQLFVQRKFVSEHAKEVFGSKGGVFTDEVYTLWEILVKAVALEQCGNVICVIDALDECSRKTQEQLIPLLAPLSGSRNPEIPLKLLVTSRPYSLIERGLCLRTPTIRLKGEEEIGAVTADITRFIGDGIAELEEYWKRPGGLGYLRNLLETSADRTFLWVSLVLTELKASEDCSSEELTRIATTAPRDLAEFYSKILGNIRSHTKALKILKIAVAAARPLTLQEFNVAFRINRGHGSVKDLECFSPEFERTVKNLCGHFIRIIDSKIYFVHQTAREFLLKGSLTGQGSSQYTLCPKDSNFALADICISYLSLEEFENDPLAIGTNSRVATEALDDYLQKYTFLDYAARHWADHFRDSGDQQMELFKSTQLICKGGSKRFLTWFQVCLFYAERSYGRPNDFTHLLVASWLGQVRIVEQLLDEGADINSRSKKYGTALNIAAARKDKDMTRMLLDRNARARLGGKEYSVLHMKRSELEAMLEELREVWRRWSWESRDTTRFWWEARAIEFLKSFCIQDTPDLHAQPSPGL